jgi:hypothetical protein
MGLRDKMRGERMKTGFDFDGWNNAFYPPRTKKRRKAPQSERVWLLPVCDKFDRKTKILRPYKRIQKTDVTPFL